MRFTFVGFGRSVDKEVQNVRLIPGPEIDRGPGYVLPTMQKSFVTYEYKCHCDSR